MSNQKEPWEYRQGDRCFSLSRTAEKLHMPLEELNDWISRLDPEIREHLIYRRRNRRGGGHSRKLNVSALERTWFDGQRLDELFP